MNQGFSGELVAVPAQNLAVIPAMAEGPVQYLTFMLAGEMFAISITFIKEIIEYRNITQVPMMPPAVRGVINLRGTVVPVMDLQLRFGREASPVSRRTCCVIVEIETGGERQTVGLLVDAVCEVLELGAEDILPAPSFGARIRTDFINSVARVRGSFVIVLDVDRLFAAEELSAIAEMVE